MTKNDIEQAYQKAQANKVAYETFLASCGSNDQVVILPTAFTVMVIDSETGEYKSPFAAIKDHQFKGLESSNTIQPINQWALLP